MPGQYFDVFISYSSHDAEIAARLAAQLKEVGLEPWLDQWYDQVEPVSGLRSSKACLVLVGALGEDERPELALACEWATRDQAFSLFARQNVFRLVVLLLPGLPESFKITTLPAALHSFPLLDLRNNFDDPATFEQLVKLLKDPPSSIQIQPASAPEFSALAPVKLDEAPVLTVGAEPPGITSLTSKRSKQKETNRKGRLPAWALILAGLMLAVIVLQLILLTAKPETSATPSAEETLARITAQALEKERDATEQNRKLSLSRELAANALLQSQTDSELALLLALEANKVAHTEEAESALRQVLSLPTPHLTVPTANAQISQVVFSPDGTLVATTGSGSYDFPDDKKEIVAQVWEVSTGKEVSRVIEENPSSWMISFSPDSKLLLLSNYYHTVKLVEARTGKTVRELTEIKAPDALVSSAFSPDGKLVLTSYRNTPNKIWEVATGNLIANNLPGDAPVFSPDSQKLVTLNGTILRVWEISTGKELAKLDPSTLISTTGNHFQLTATAWSPDGTKILMGGGSGFAGFWAWKTSNTVTFRDSLSNLWVRQVGFSADGKTAIVLADRSYLRIFDTDTGQERGGTYNTADYFGFNGVAWSADSHWGVSTSEQQQVRLWDLTNLDWSSSYVELRVPKGSNAVAFSQDSKLIATGGRDGKLRIWSLNFLPDGVEVGRSGSTAYTPVQLSQDGKMAVKIDAKRAIIYDTTTGKEITSLNHSDFIRTTAFSPDSRLIITGGDDTTARAWETRSGKLVAELSDHSERIGWVAFNPANKLIVATSSNKTVRLWNIASPDKPIAQFDLSGFVTGLVFSPDGKLLALPVSRTLYIYDTATQSEIFRLEHPDFINSLSFSPDGNKLLTASARTAFVWEAATGQNLLKLDKHQDKVGYATFSPDGNLVVTAEQNSAHLWQAPTGKLLGDIPGIFASPSGVSSNAAFSPDNKLLLTAQGGGRAQLWEVASLKKLQEVAVPDANGYNDATSVAFNPDGKTFLLSASTGLARIYDCKLCGSLEELLDLARVRLARQLTPEERQQFLHDPILN